MNQAANVPSTNTMSNEIRKVWAQQTLHVNQDPYIVKNNILKYQSNTELDTSAPRIQVPLV